MEYETHVHEFPPFYRPDSTILILGSFPSVKSREQKFFYGHPQNRFWKVVSSLQGEPLPQSIPEKASFLERSRIALWDVIEQCEIRGSSDSSIRNVIPTDLRIILDVCPVRAIFANGALAGRLYEKYQKERCGREITVLPSTSPANAAWTLPRLLEAWSVLLDAGTG